VNTRAEVKASPSLSLTARPGEGGVRTRRIALLMAEGADTEALSALHEALLAAGAVPRYVGAKLGSVGEIDVEVTLEAAPSVLFDAVVLPGGEAADALMRVGQALEFIKDQYRHCKPLLVLDSGERLLEAAGIPATLPDGQPDPGILHGVDGEPPIDEFIAAVARHRHFERQTDPPRV
jgi:catalase